MKSNWKINVAVALAIAAAPVAALGCGTESDSGAETSGPLTKTEFLKSGDQICKKRIEEKDAAIKKGLEELSPEELAKPSEKSIKDLGEGVLPPVEALTSELKELSPPAADKAEVQHIIDALDAGLAKTEADPASLGTEDPFKEAADAARAYGFESCNL